MKQTESRFSPRIFISILISLMWKNAERENSECRGKWKVTRHGSVCEWWFGDGNYIDIGHKYIHIRYSNGEVEVSVRINGIECIIRYSKAI